VSPRFSDALLRVQSDDRLAMLARSGHERAFVAIVERYRRPLHVFARRLVPEPRVDDVLQQSFVNAWAALSAGAEVRHLRGWLHQIVRNAAIAAARTPGEDQLSETMIGDHGPQAEVERRLQLEETLRHVARLPEQQRLALVQTAMEGRSREEIASGLGLSEGAVRGLVHRARSTLRAAATAITPLPVAVWAAQGGGAPVSEVAAGAGAGSMAGLAVKAGTVAVATGAIATSVATDLPRRIQHRHHARPAVAALHQVEHPPVTTPAAATAPPTRRAPASASASTLVIRPTVARPAPAAAQPVVVAAPSPRHRDDQHRSDDDRTPPPTSAPTRDDGAETDDQQQPVTTTAVESSGDNHDGDGGGDGGDTTDPGSGSSSGSGGSSRGMD
jgi:RNA polymerase sigma factor (sigma-70 family)